ncbi:MAG TPA: LPS assembly lipoprotein LptE [Acidobacteriota bacterium]|nr:LPS assembly lipoprotein LptE [Acidobacteriota bacterium]
MPVTKSESGLSTFGLRVSTFFLSLALLSAYTGCGYHVNAPTPALAKLQILAIPMLKNSTSVFQVEQRLTRALIEEFSRRSPYHVTSSESGADAVVRGEVFFLSATPVIIGTQSFGTTFLVTMYVKVSVVDLKTNKTLFRNDNYTFREQYVINRDVQQFFSELNPALERMARDFARSVAASVLVGN